VIIPLNIVNILFLDFGIGVSNSNNPSVMEELQLGVVISPFTVHLNDRLSLRIYEDTRPHILETGALQKGLVLMLDGKELIEEGLGFGVPVIKYHDKTYFSSRAKISKQKTTSGYLIKKTFVLDTISKKTWRGSNINDNFYSTWHKKFAKIYLSHKELSPFFNRLMEYRELAGIKTEFVNVKPRGKVAIEYLIKDSLVEVSVDFSDLTLKGCEELLVLNEQGSTVFDKYIDSNGLVLAGAKIGGWHPVTAKRASIENSNGLIAFQINATPVALLYRGWEKTKNRFSWAGLSYSLPPFCRTFGYAIDIKR
jgi:hypothetical protein